MSKEMMQNMIEEERSKKIILKFMDEVKKRKSYVCRYINKIPSMSLEEAVKNLFAVKDIEKLLTIHAEYLVEGKTMGSNQTTMMK
jgi:hypothetical protein